MTYKDAGVDIDAADEANRLMKKEVQATYTEAVMSDLGSFGGLFRLDATGKKEPLLVASTDGVGTKLKLAYRTGLHDTVGRDLVNHCINDILVQGAMPLFFLDYIGTSKLRPHIIAAIVKGISEGCRQAGIPLLGGETAEMPGIYQREEYDLAGTIIGLVDRKDLLPRDTMEEGDLIIGLPSEGLHTNGHSLAQRIIFDTMGLAVEDAFPGTDRTVAEILMAPHRCYLSALKGIIRDSRVKGLAHITGGGLTDNIPRVLPAHLQAIIDRDAWMVPQLFTVLEKEGNIPQDDLYRTFNMGIGMVLIIAGSDNDDLLRALGKQGQDFHIIGRLQQGKRKVVYQRASTA